MFVRGFSRSEFQSPGAMLEMALSLLLARTFGGPWSVLLIDLRPGLFVTDF